MESSGTVSIKVNYAPVSNNAISVRNSNISMVRPPKPVKL